MNEEGIAERAATTGAYAMSLLGGLQARYPYKIADVRGLGLMIGVELTFPGKDVWKSLLDRGFVCNLTQGSVLRLLPPLTISQDDMKAFAENLREILSLIN